MGEDNGGRWGLCQPETCPPTAGLDPWESIEPTAPSAEFGVILVNLQDLKIFMPDAKMKK